MCIYNLPKSFDIEYREITRNENSTLGLLSSRLGIEIFLEYNLDLYIIPSLTSCTHFGNCCSKNIQNSLWIDLYFFQVDEQTMK